MNVSVVIPAYNEEDNIGDCLSSLTSQMEPGDEIIVVDNGSTDETQEVVLSFDGVRVIYAPDEALDTNDDRPIGHLRQIGTEAAVNPIIASTDADTLPPDGWLDRIKGHFESDPNLSLVWGVAVDSKGVPIRNLTGKYLTFIGGVSGCNTAFRKSHFGELDKGYLGWPLFEDFALVTRMARTGKTVHDENLMMVTHLDRNRYQTKPITFISLSSMVIGARVGGTTGDILKGGGASLLGTEIVYEYIGETGINKAGDYHIHHDTVGIGALVAGSAMDSNLVTGAGVGVMAHHILTEGVSALPTDLHKNTDKVVEEVAN